MKMLPIRRKKDKPGSKEKSGLPHRDDKGKTKRRMRSYSNSVEYNDVCCP